MTKNIKNLVIAVMAVISAITSVQAQQSTTADKARQYTAIRVKDNGPENYNKKLQASYGGWQLSAFGMVSDENGSGGGLSGGYLFQRNRIIGFLIEGNVGVTYRETFDLKYASPGAGLDVSLLFNNVSYLDPINGYSRVLFKATFGAGATQLKNEKYLAEYGHRYHGSPLYVRGGVGIGARLSPSCQLWLTGFAEVHNNQAANDTPWSAEDFKAEQGKMNDLNLKLELKLTWTIQTGKRK
jgi:hypothetical protein